MEFLQENTQKYLSLSAKVKYMVKSKTIRRRFSKLTAIIVGMTVVAPIHAMAATDAPFVVRSHAPHQLQIIQTGVAGLAKRLEMIDKAKSFIDVEYFIYNVDEAGRIFTQALVQKKRKNPQMRIRVLVDAGALYLQVKGSLVSQLDAEKIEVRYYNPSPLIDVVDTQYRDHRKLLLVDTTDGLEAITGSRNIADEYFDMNESFNFTDRDIVINGPIVKSMGQAFNKYWDDQRVVPALNSGGIDLGQTQPTAIDFLTESGYDKYVKYQVQTVGGKELANPASKGICNDITSVSDEPGFDPGQNTGSPKRKVMNAMVARVELMKDGQQLWVESPYFIIRDAPAVQAMDSLEPRHIHATLLTNSLESTDAFYVAANFLPRAAIYERLTASNIFIYSGKPPQSLPAILGGQHNQKLVANAGWGIHSKTFVFGDSAFAIGTFNLDPRSADINTEMMILCEGNKELTSFVVNNIKAKLHQSRELEANGQPVDGGDILKGAGLLKRIEFVFSLLPASILDFLM